MAFAEKYKAIASEIPRAPDLDDIYYPSIQLVKWNSTPSASKPAPDKITFAAIAGHNGVSHNHNDVGSFVLYVDGLPVFIDVGVGTYNALTFSNKRYTIWNMQSQWHSIPTINGHMQKDGKSFAAQEVYYHKDKLGHFRMDLAKAYPVEAAVKSWKRAYTFDPKTGELSIQEQYTLQRSITKQQINWITLHKPQLKPGEIILPLAGAKQVVLQYDARVFEVHIDAQILEDNRHRKVWGEQIYRIVMTEKKQALTKKFGFKIQTRQGLVPKQNRPI